MPDNADSGHPLRYPSSFLEELAAVPRGRRRLGWLLIAFAILLGTSVLFALFFSSLYMSNPSAMQAALIEALSQRAPGQLDPDAMDRAEELESAFGALSNANEVGSLGWREIWAVWLAYAETSQDGVLDSEDVDRLVDAIREAVTGASSPRRL